MNWGKKIVLIYAIFIIGIMLLVFKASRQNDDLVTSDYYNKELKYQQRIDEMNRTNALPDSILYRVSGNHARFQFPKQFAGKKISGEVLLYCPSNEKKDVSQHFNINELETEIYYDRIEGAYELQLSWEVEGIDYYLTRKITI